MAAPIPGTIAHDRLPVLTGRVMITGGGGFIARAILRRAQREQWNCTFTLLARDESFYE